MQEIMGTKDIAFPHLGIYLSNIPKGFTIFGFYIAFYGIMIGLGVLGGILVAEKAAKREGMNPEIIWDFAFPAVVLSVIGARIYYVIFAWDVYKDNLLSILNFRQGGLAIYGGVIVAFAFLFTYCKIKKINPLLLGDCGICGLLTGQIIGRWGNFFNREAFGDYTNNLFAMALPVDYIRSLDDVTQNHRHAMEAAGVNYIQVHPTFLYESLWNLGLLIFIFCFQKRKKYNGQMCLMYLGGYGIGRFLIEGLRTDQLKLIGTQIPVSQMLGLVLFIFSVVTHVIVRTKQKKSAK